MNNPCSAPFVRPLQQNHSFAAWGIFFLIEVPATDRVSIVCNLRLCSIQSQTEQFRNVVRRQKGSQFRIHPRYETVGDPGKSKNDTGFRAYRPNPLPIYQANQSQV